MVKWAICTQPEFQQERREKNAHNIWGAVGLAPG
jgi:hypothetical protein